MTESFFSSPKIERTARKVHSARAAVFDDLKRSYNRRRYHSKLRYLSRMAFQARAIKT